jgi:cytochrome c oxidase subunit 2
MRAVIAVLVVAACGSPEPAPPAPAGAPALVDQGKLLATKLLCTKCHTSDGTAGVGPTLKGYFGMKLTQDDGTIVVGSAARLRSALERASPLKDYPPSMPPYGGMINEHDLRALVAYVQSL